MQLPRRPAAASSRRPSTTRSPPRCSRVLTPEQIALALSAADQVADRHQRGSRAAELAVERVRYDADRAERAFHACEPKNRLVARTLEACWETKPAAGRRSASRAQSPRPPTACYALEWVRPVADIDGAPNSIPMIVAF